MNSPLSVTGDFTLASGSFGGSGAVTIAGSASQWTGGQIDVGSGGFTNTGTLSADTTGGNLVLTGAGTLVNSGTITETGGESLVIENGATLNNAKGATFDLTDNANVAQGGSGGTLTIRRHFGENRRHRHVNPQRRTLNNTGTVMVKSGTVSVTGTVTQITGSTLTAGTWDVTGSKTVHPTLSLSTSFNTLGTKARVTLNGPNNGGQPVFTNLASLADILAGGSLTLAGGVGVTTMGALTNNGLLTLEAGDALTIGGAFAESSTATLTIHLGGSNSVPSFGQIVSAGPVSLAGKLVLEESEKNLDYTSPETLQFITNTGTDATTGTFAGRPEGSQVTVGLLTFTIHYAGGTGSDVTLSLESNAQLVLDPSSTSQETTVAGPTFPIHSAQVIDAQGHGVANQSVTFTIHSDNGASGSFLGVGPPTTDALSFNGSSEYVEVPTSPSLDSQALTTQATLEAWVYLNELPSVAGHIMTIIAKSESGNDLDLQVGTDNRVYLYAGDVNPGSGNFVASQTILKTGAWYWIAATYQAGSSGSGLLQIYINGKLDASQAGTFARATNPNPLTIGWDYVFPVAISTVRSPIPACGRRGTRGVDPEPDDEPTPGE